MRERDPFQTLFGEPALTSFIESRDSLREVDDEVYQHIHMNIPVSKMKANPFYVQNRYVKYTSTSNSRSEGKRWSKAQRFDIESTLSSIRARLVALHDRIDTGGLYPAAKVEQDGESEEGDGGDVGYLE